MEKDWKIKEKNRKNYYERAFNLWKLNFLPAKIAMHQLKIVNHNLKLNSQTKHWAENNETKEINGQCTFCKISMKTIPIPEESYRHLFLDCIHSKEVLKKATEMFKIPLPNTTKKGELLLYFFPWKDKWECIRINVFYMLYKYYITTCKYQSRLPTLGGIEKLIRSEIKLMIVTNQNNKDLLYNLIPLWTGKEIYMSELPEALIDREGEDFRGKFFLGANRKLHILESKVHKSFDFPITTQNSKYHKINEVKNYSRMTKFMH
jgi:hypothetical protein